METDEELEDDPFEMPQGTNFANRINADIVARELNEYRNDTRYLYTHFNGSVFWNVVPYEADPSIRTVGDVYQTISPRGAIRTCTCNITV